MAVENLIGRTDFKSWQRGTLEQFARQVADENKQLREDNKTLLDAWRSEVESNALRLAQPGQSSRPGTEGS